MAEPAQSWSTETPLKILHLEDEPDFCQLVKDLLAKDGIASDLRVVGNLSEFNSAVENNHFDIILADYTLPGCTGIQALQEAAQRCPQTPFVLVSGAIGEQPAIEALRHGATDYVLKQRPERLVPVIRRAVQEAQAEDARRASERHFRSLFENMMEGFAYCRVLFREGRPYDFTYLATNAAFERLTGLNNVVGRNATEVIPGIHESSPELLETYGRVALTSQPERFETYVPAMGMWFSISVYSPEKGCFVAVFDNITERKHSALELEQLHSQLLEVSRQAAIAEFATAILHNVGNVLNSVGVASSCLAESLRNSKTNRLSQIVGLMREHEVDLADFFRNDPKGKLVPGYLAQLAGKLTREHAAALQEISQLQANVEHIKAIITVQQDVAKRSTVPELLKVTDLVNDALKINSNALARGKIEVIKAYGEISTSLMQKHRVLQILVNLVRNAIQACEASASDHRVLKIRVTQTDSRLVITVADNGVGISSKDFARIFTLGFTTKKEGHGFGLHSSMLDAKDMGGSMTVQSAGPGLGATFTLELPVNSASGH